MEIDSKFVGTSLKDYSCQIDWREMMNYAAAVGDNNEWYFDDEREDGIVAPPMFAIAISWPIIENLAEFIHIDDFPYEVMMTLVHYTEHLKIHRLMKNGDEITIQGRVAVILPHQAGTHIVLRLNAIDKKSEPVFTEYIGGMLRGVECIGGGKGKENIPKIPLHKDELEPLWKENIFIDALRSYIYDGCSGITFPIHTSREFARQVGLPGIIMQGTATLAYAIRELTNREANGNPIKIKEIACRFTNMVIPGTDIQIVLNSRVKTGKTTDLSFNVYNEGNKRAISNGYVLLGE